ncbi:MAG: glycosyltransferase [Paraclostridium sp.]
MKKKILFMVINMNVGGTEKALLTMLSTIDKEKYDVTVLMLEKYGDFLEEIPDWVSIKYLDGYKEIKNSINNPIPVTILKSLVRLDIPKFFNMLKIYYQYKLNKDTYFITEYLLKDYPMLDEEYDLAVAYAGPMELISYFVINKIKAKKKIQWVHFDVSKIDFNQKFVEKIYNQFDKIFTVSKQGKDKLIERIPSIKDKTDVFYNIVSSEIITRLAYEGDSFDDDFKGVRILTVGRLTHIKGQHMTIPVLARLRKEGYNVRWYCIGEGMGRQRCEELIKEYKVEDDYILLGSNSNPYPFMKDCDIYVQSSKHEGYCITLAEARCFNNPIVTTNFTGASEQITSYEDGLIAEINEVDVYEKLKELLCEDELRNKIKSNIIKHRIDTTGEINKLYKCIDEI